MQWPSINQVYIFRTCLFYGKLDKFIWLYFPILILLLFNTVMCVYITYAVFKNRQLKIFLDPDLAFWFKNLLWLTQHFSIDMNCHTCCFYNDTYSISLLVKVNYNICNCSGKLSPCLEREAAEKRDLTRCVFIFASFSAWGSYGETLMIMRYVHSEAFLVCRLQCNYNVW